MKKQDLTKVITKVHENKWVALSTDYKKVVDYSENLVQLKNKVGVEKVVYMKILPSNTKFAF